MTTHLDLDDVCAGNTKAQEELTALRAQVAALTEQRQLWLDKDLTAQALVEQEREIERLTEAIRYRAKSHEINCGLLATKNEQLAQQLERIEALTDALGKAREALGKSYAYGNVMAAQVIVEALAAIDGVLNQQEISTRVTGTEVETWPDGTPRAFDNYAHDKRFSAESLPAALGEKSGADGKYLNAVREVMAAAGFVTGEKGGA